MNGRKSSLLHNKQENFSCSSLAFKLDETNLILPFYPKQIRQTQLCLQRMGQGYFSTWKSPLGLSLLRDVDVGLIRQETCLASPPNFATNIPNAQ